VAATLGADIVIQSRDEERVVPADDFFLGAMSTALEPGFCVKELRFPVWREGRLGVGFHEISARKSDFAYVSAAVQLAADNDDKCLNIVLGLGGLSDRPVRISLESIIGKDLRATSLSAVVAEAVGDACDGIDLRSDIHASASYRRRLAISLAQRAMRDAVDRALQDGGEAQ
jgi:CO/xanthine dehydrogenase FAD-binding subunit